MMLYYDEVVASISVYNDLSHCTGFLNEPQTIKSLYYNVRIPNKVKSFIASIAYSYKFESKPTTIIAKPTSSYAVLPVYEPLLFKNSTRNNLPTTIYTQTLPNNYITEVKSIVTSKYGNYTSRSICATSRLVVIDEKNENLNLKTFAIIQVKQVTPDTLFSNQCIPLSELGNYIKSNIQEITIGIPVGEFVTFFETPKDITITKIYKKPFTVTYTETSISGRFLTTDTREMIVKLSSGQVIKLKIKPQLTQVVTSLF